MTLPILVPIFKIGLSKPFIFTPSMMAYYEMRYFPSTKQFSDSNFIV